MSISLTKKILAWMLAVALAITMVPFMNVSIHAATGQTLSNPIQAGDGTIWDCVYFGSYPQSKNGNNGYKNEPIKWFVLQVDGDDAFLVSDAILDGQAYNNSNVKVTWEDCSLRSWLNSTFIYSAFSAAERSAIPYKYILNEGSTKYNREGSNSTYDRVFLLSEQEVTNSTYGFSTEYGTTHTRCSANTAYTARLNGRDPIWDDWLLRTPASETFNDVGAVEMHGNLHIGTSVSSVCGVRPAIHLDISQTDVWSYAGVDYSEYVGSSSDIYLPYVWPDSSNKTYTGSPVTQKFTVLKNGNELVEGTDYKVSYRNNVNVGTAATIIEGITTTWLKTLQFKINPASLSQLSLSRTSAGYDGSSKKPTVTVKNAAGDTLTENQDYTVAYSGDCTAIGDYTVTVTGMGNYTGSLSSTFTVKEKEPLSKLTLSPTSATYDGTAKTPAIIVTNAAGDILTENTDYTVECSGDCIEEGDYTITVTGMEEYTGTLSATFTVKKQTSGGGGGGSGGDIDQKPEAVTNAENAIGLLNTSDVSLASEEKIIAARKAYDALSADEKKQVSNYSKLEDAEKALKEYKDKYVPQQVKVTGRPAGYDSVELSWPTVDKAESFEVYRKPSRHLDTASDIGKQLVKDGYELLDTIKPGKSATLSYIDKGLDADTEYQYIVVAVNHDSKNRKIEVASEEITATPGIGQVMNLKITKGKKSATVKWSALSGAAGYKVYRSTKKDSGFKCVRTIKGKDTKFVNKKLKSKKTYYFKVRAFARKDGKTAYGAFSEVKSVKTK